MEVTYSAGRLLEFQLKQSKILGTCCFCLSPIKPFKLLHMLSRNVIPQQFAPGFKPVDPVKNDFQHCNERNRQEHARHSPECSSH